MRKENEIYCSNCGVLINIDSRFCPSCGFEQLDFNSSQFHKTNSKQIIEETLNTFESRTEKETDIEKSENKIYTKWWFWLIFIIIIGALYPKKSGSKSNFSTSESTDSNYGTNNCVGVGNQSCIDKVRQNFTNTGKTILGEQYLGDGRFGISFMDRQYPGAYNATVSTDCNCNVTNSNVTTIR
jgi:hypothetical protein